MNKNKKRLLIFLLASLLIFTIGVFSVSCTEKEEENRPTVFAVASDIHLFANSFLTKDNVDFYSWQDKMIHLSEPLFKTFADRIIAEKYDFLIITGDLTEKGDETSHLVVVETLRQIEQAGTEVFVINGNHDVMNNESKKKTAITQKKFAELYAEFGYNQAISVCSESLSYSADLNEEYRLIAVDNISYYIDGTQDYPKDELTEEDRLWIYEQVEQAFIDGKEPVFVAHKPFMFHFPEIVKLVRDDYSTMAQAYERFYTFFRDSDVNLGFVGHNHINDALSYGSFTEIQTGSLCFYQPSYREITCSENSFDIKTKSIGCPDKKYISDVLSDKTLSEINDDFAGYTEKHFSQTLLSLLQNYKKSLIDDNLSFPAEYQPIKSAITTVFDRILFAPIYNKDKGQGSDATMQEILSLYGVTIPETGYNTLADVIVSMIGGLIGGDENFNSSIETELITYAVYCALYRLNQFSETLSSLQGAPQLSLNLDEVFSTGILECYESNLMPYFVYAVDKMDINGLIKNIVASLENSFEMIENVSGFINVFLDGIGDKLNESISLYTIDLKDFIDKVIFSGILSDLIEDKMPADLFLSVERTYSAE